MNHLIIILISEFIPLARNRSFECNISVNSQLKVIQSLLILLTVNINILWINFVRTWTTKSKKSIFYQDSWYHFDEFLVRSNIIRWRCTTNTCKGFIEIKDDVLAQDYNLVHDYDKKNRFLIYHKISCKQHGDKNAKKKICMKNLQKWFEPVCRIYWNFWSSKSSLSYSVGAQMSCTDNQ